MALGTPVAINMITTASGSYTYFKHHLIYFDIALTTGIVGGIASIAGARLTTFFSGKQMMFIFCGFLIVLGILLIFREEQMESEEKKTHQEIKKTVQHPIKKSLVLGLIIGFISGFLGLGGGFLMVPLFMFWFEIESHHAVATSLLAAMIISLPNAITHYFLGHVDLMLVGLCGIGAVIGSQIGSRTVLKIKGKTLRWTVIASYFILSIALIAFELFNQGLA